MKKAVIVLSILTALMMSACTGESAAGNESGGRGSIDAGQDSDGDKTTAQSGDDGLSKGGDDDDRDKPDDDTVLTEYDGADENIESAVYDIERIYQDDLLEQIIEGSETPVFVGYGLGGESGYVTAETDDAEVINGFIEALRELTIKSTDHNPESDMYVADGGEDIVFAMEDGRQFNISMDGRIWIHKDDVVFELGNTGRLSEMCVMMQEIAYMNQGGGNVPDDYIAVLRGGVGEKTVETYVYELDEGYKYINVTSTTVSWGSPQWDHVVDKIGTVSTKEEVIEKAKEHGADNCMTLPGEFNAHPIEDFL